MILRGQFPCTWGPHGSLFSASAYELGIFISFSRSSRLMPLRSRLKQRSNMVTAKFPSTLVTLYRVGGRLPRSCLKGAPRLDRWAEGRGLRHMLSATNMMFMY